MNSLLLSSMLIWDTEIAMRVLCFTVSMIGTAQLALLGTEMRQKKRKGKSKSGMHEQTFGNSPSSGRSHRRDNRGAQRPHGRGGRRMTIHDKGKLEASRGQRWRSPRRPHVSYRSWAKAGTGDFEQVLKACAEKERTEMGTFQAGREREERKTGKEKHHLV